MFGPLCRAESQHPLVSTAQSGSLGIWHCCVAQSGSTLAAVGVAEFTGASLLVFASDLYPLYRGINAGFALNAEATRTAASRRPFPRGAHVNKRCRSRQTRRAANLRAPRAAIVSASALFCARAASVRVTKEESQTMKEKESNISRLDHFFLQLKHRKRQMRCYSCALIHFDSIQAARKMNGREGAHTHKRGTAQ